MENHTTVNVTGFEMMRELDNVVGVAGIDSLALKGLTNVFFALCVTAGHLFLRSGTTHSGIVISGMSQNFINLLVTAALWWMYGYALSLGDSSPFIGGAEGDYFMTSFPPDSPTKALQLCKFYETWVILSIVLGVASAGAVGRIGWEAYLLVAFALATFGYIPASHWVWGADGWLSPQSPERLGSGLLDAGGVVLVHVFGGAAALTMEVLLPTNKQEEVSHDKFSVGTGAVLIWFGWYGQLACGGVHDVAAIAHAFCFLTIGAGSAGTISFLLEEGEGLYLSHLVRCTVAGLVSCTSAGFYCPMGYSFLIGSVGAVVATAGSKLVAHHKLFDPFDAVSAHLLAGIWGSLATALFADKEMVRSLGYTWEGKGSLLGVHLLAVVVIVGWVVFWTFLIVNAVKALLGTSAVAYKDRLNHGGVYCELVCKNDASEQFVGLEMTSRDGSVAPSTTETPPPIKMLDSGGGGMPKVSLAFAVRLAVYATLVGGVTALSASNEAPDVDADSVVHNYTFEDVAATAAKVAKLNTDLDTMWMLQCGVCVFLMQMGFCFLEAGSVRSVNVINIIFKNLVDCSLGALMWWMTGYAFAFGKGSGFIGGEEAMFALSPKPGDALFGSMAHFFLSFTYMTASCTIVSGAVAERMNLYAYCLFVVVTCGFTYPVVVHWGWSSTGFLSAFSEDRIWGNGLLDFAGSGVIHLFGGTSALCLAYLIGPRKLRDDIDVFSEEGQAIVSPHNKFQQAAGTLILWFSWFMFNGGSVANFSNGGSAVAAQAIVSTCISSSAAGLVGLLCSRYFCGFLDIGHACNSVLVGLVSITSACAYVEIAFSPLIGAVGVVFYFAIHKLRMRLRIDDVVDAGAVHFGGGLWGCIATGLFCNEEIMTLSLQREVDGHGLFTGGGGTQLGVQLLYCLVCFAWSLLCASIIFLICKHTMGHRAHEEAELRGLDVYEHKAHSYDYIEKMEKERAMAIDSVVMAQDIASSLVSFDLDAAEAALSKSASSEINELRGAFWSLLQNLTCYRPYLPDSLFNNDAEEGAAEGLPPGANGKAAIVFTDIQGSTASWEAYPAEMREALRIHNRVIRTSIKKHKGYEVKTIGDAFMVAFEEAEEAASFSLEIQRNLHDVGSEWPIELADLPQCQFSVGPFSGLRVRIGLNYGCVHREVNPITQRTDYSGPTVNRAARLEAAATGGSVAISEDIHELLDKNGWLGLEGPDVTAMQGVSLKGVAGTHNLSLLVPHELAKLRKVATSPQGGRNASNPHLTVPIGTSANGSALSTPLSKDRKLKAQSKASAEVLKLTKCTIAQVWAEPNLNNTTAGEVLDQVNNTLIRLIANADRTDGTIQGVNGSRATVAWNISKRCLSHVQSGIRFVSFAEEQFNTSAMTVGLMNGSVLHGRVGTRDQRFVNVYGQAMVFSEHVVQAARELSVFCVLGVMPGQSPPAADPYLAPVLRPIAKWRVQAEFLQAGMEDSAGGPPIDPTPEGLLILYQVMPKVGEHLTALDFKLACADNWSWTQAYANAFEREDLAVIQEHCNEDPIVRRVLSMLRGEASLKSMPFWVQAEQPLCLIPHSP